MGNNIKSASHREDTKSFYEEESTIPPSSTNYQDDLQSYKSYITQHQVIDQIQFRSLPDKFCSVRILIMQSGMNGNTLMYDTHHDNSFKQFKAKLNQNTKEVNERFRKMQMLKSTKAVNKIKNSSPSLKPLLGVLSQNNLNQSFQSQPNNTSSNNNNNNKNSVGMNDTSILGEILFGSIPIQILGQNTKIHTLPQHKQTCLSKVFRVGLPVSAIIKADIQSDHGDDSSSTSKDILPTTEPNPTGSPTSSPTVGSLVRNRAVSIIQQPNTNQVSATAYSPNTLGTRNRSYSTSVTDAIRENLVEKVATSSTNTPEDPKQAHKKNRKKKPHKDQDISFMCKSSFGIAVLLVFHDCGEDKDELQNPSQLQRLIFSHFPIFEHKLRKLLNSCKNSIQNYLKKKVEEARESDKLDEIFSGFTFNIKSFHGCLQDSVEISNASIDFNKFMISFLHAPRFNEPIWQSQSLVPFAKSNNFSTFLTDLALLTRKDEQHMSFFSLVLTTILSNHLSWVSQFTHSERSDCDDNPSLLIQKYLKSLYGSGYLPTITSGEHEKKGLKKFCKIIVVGSNNRDIRYCISMITFLLQSTLLLEKEFSIDKLQQSNSLDSKSLPETLLTLTPMQFVEMKPPLRTKPRQKPLYENNNTNLNRAIHTIESDSDEDSEYHIKPVVLVPKPNFTLAPYNSEVEEMNMKMKFNKFGNSLFADVCTWYCGGFVISGLPRYVNFQKELIEDLEFIQTESIDGDSRLPDVASCIIIDIEGKSCNVVTSKHKTAKFEEGHNSSIISKLLHELLFLRSMDQTAEGEKACEQIFKDTLYGLVLKTKLMFSIVDSIDLESNRATNAIHWRSDAKQTPTKSLSEQLKKILVSKPKKNGAERITYDQLAHLLHVNITDIPLLMSIASAFRSDIAKKVIPHKVSKKKKR